MDKKYKAESAIREIKNRNAHLEEVIVYLFNGGSKPNHIYIKQYLPKTSLSVFIIALCDF